MPSTGLLPPSPNSLGDLQLKLQPAVSSTRGSCPSSTPCLFLPTCFPSTEPFPCSGKPGKSCLNARKYLSFLWFLSYFSIFKLVIWYGFLRKILFILCVKVLFLLKVLSVPYVWMKTLNKVTRVCLLYASVYDCVHVYACFKICKACNPRLQLL